MSLRKYILEQKIKNITAYHGSPYKFDKFKMGIYSTSGQYASDHAFWFAINKDIAKRWALDYPNEMYDELKEISEKYNELLEEEKKNVINNISEDDKETIIVFFEGFNEEFAYKLKRDFNEMLIISPTHINILMNHLGDSISEIPNILNNVFSQFKDHHKEFLQREEKERDKIKDIYSERSGYLYTVNIKTKNMLTLRGEDIGTGVQRQAELATAESSGYDAVYIIDADTGAGIGDEVAVFDSKNITILKAEEVN